MLKELLLAGCGGFVGTACRYLVSKWSAVIWHNAFPLGTFLVNITGCFIIGILFGLFENTKIMTPTENALLITGFCGGFTTFSTFANDIWILGQKGEWLSCALYIGLSIVCSLLCVWAGRAIVRYSIM